jgi:hypothetical protein
MGMKKAGTATPAAAPVAAAAPVTTAPSNVESGAAAAVERLKKAKPVETTVAAKGYTPRDYDKEARGKTRCVQFEAALMSPAIAGMKFDTLEEYLKLCHRAADYGTSYTFGEEVPF